MNNNHRKGFTIVETLTALIITSFALILLSACLHLLRSSFKEFYRSDDEISIRQLRLIYSLSSNPEINGSMLSLMYMGEGMYFEQIDQSLLLRPGYQVYLKDVDEVSFYKEDACIFVSYKRKNKKEVNRNIGC